MEITYYGHACFQVNIEGKNILFDPFIEGNPLAKDIDIDQIKADYIFITHGHGDHIGDLERIYQNTKAKIYANYEVISWFEGKGISEGHPLNHGGRLNLDFGSVKMVNAIHSSSMPDGSYGGNPAGFVIETKDKSFYFAGDTALHMDMKLIGAYHNLDFAFMPIGDNFTMGIDDALIAASFVGVDKIIGMHYDSFPYIEIDHDEAFAKAKDKRIELKLIEIGKTITI